VGEFFSPVSNYAASDEFYQCPWQKIKIGSLIEQ
jgi:hypothetical protein